MYFVHSDRAVALDYTKKNAAKWGLRYNGLKAGFHHFDNADLSIWLTTNNGYDSCVVRVPRRGRVDTLTSFYVPIQNYVSRHQLRKAYGAGLFNERFAGSRTLDAADATVDGVTNYQITVKKIAYSKK
jgi:hypothetical protein